MDELGEFLEAYLIHHNVENGIGLKYFTPLDEPNNTGYDLASYEGVVTALSSRIESSPHPEIQAVELLVPASSQFSEPANGTTVTGLEWAEYLYAYHDEKVDGIDFHLWWCRNLLSLHRFRSEVLLACKVMEDFDTDGDKAEMIVLDQTNMMPGADSSPFDANSFHASLWWAGVVCSALGTGRVSALNWFPTVDDEHHMKGLMYGPSENYALKPVGHAMRFVIDHRLSEVLEARADHPEVDALATFEPATGQLSLLVVNKGRRRIRASISPGDFVRSSLHKLHGKSGRTAPARGGGWLQPGVFKLQRGDGKTVRETPPGKSGPAHANHQIHVKLKYVLEPETIYAFRFGR
jgi:hypothetical protein